MNPKSIVTIAVGPVTYKVRQRARVNHGGRLEGIVDHEKCVISIDRAFPNDGYQLRLDHERGHCVMVQAGCRQALTAYVRPDVDMVDDVEETILQTFLPVCTDALRHISPSQQKFLRAVHVGGLRYRIKRLARVQYGRETVDSTVDHRRQEIRIDRSFGIEAFQASLGYEIGVTAFFLSGCRQAVQTYLKPKVDVDDVTIMFLQIFMPAYIDSIRRDTYKGDVQ